MDFADIPCVEPPVRRGLLLCKQVGHPVGLAKRDVVLAKPKSRHSLVANCTWQIGYSPPNPITAALWTLVIENKINILDLNIDLPTSADLKSDNCSDTA